MTYRKYYKNKKGMIIVDVMLALTLSTLLIFSIIQIIDSSSQVFEQAKMKNYLMNIAMLNMYEFDDLREYETKKIVISDVVIEASSLPWGNTMQEILFDIYIDKTNIHEYITVVRKSNSPDNVIDKISNNYCAVNPGLSNIVGDYQYIQNFISYKNGLTLPSTQISSSTTIVLPLNPLLPPTDFDIHDNIAFISIDSNVASDPDLIVSDITNVNSPIIKSVANTGPGISGFVTNREYLYAAAASTAAQLHILRIGPEYSLSLITKYQLPLPYATATPPLGTSILFANEKVYVGTTKWDGGEFNIIDVKDPTRPFLLGSYDIGSKVENIMIANNVAYISNAGQESLLELDISDPSNIKKIASFSPQGYERQEGKTSTVFEKKLFFGRTSGGFDISNEHELFLWNSTSSIQDIFSSKYNSVNFSGGIYGFVPSRFDLFSITRKGGNELTIFDNNTSLSMQKSVSLPILPQAITCNDRYIYVLSHNTPAILRLSFDKYKNENK